MLGGGKGTGLGGVRLSPSGTDESSCQPVRFSLQLHSAPHISARMKNTLPVN